MTTEETKAFKDRVESWLLKRECSKWYAIPATEHPELFISHVEYCIDLLDPYLLNADKTAVCNIKEFRDKHWQEFKDLEPHKWVTIKGRKDYDILVASLKYFIDVKMHGEFDPLFSKFRWCDNPNVTIKFH